MFVALLSDQFKNAQQVAHPGSGIFVANLLGRAATSELRGGRYIYSPRAAAHSMARVDKTRPTILDVDHIDWRETKNRQSLNEALQMFQWLTGFSNQVGMIRLWPGCGKTIGELTEARLIDILHTPYQQNHPSQPHILSRLQYLTAWAHPHSVVWEDWERIAHFSLGQLAQYHKPVYADITLSFHPSNRVARGKQIAAEQLVWMLHRLYALRYDGVVIRDHYEIELNIDFVEAIMSAFNQINERV